MASGDPLTEAKLKNIRAAMKSFPDFPKPGILFWDIFPIFREAGVFKDLISVMEDHIKQSYPSVEVIVGLESRGFLFAPLLAYNIGISFVPIRKKGKLPGEVASISYALEYGVDSFEIQKGAVKEGQRVVIVDDLLATGGTLRASSDLVQSVKGDVLGCVTVIELTELNGRKKLNTPCTSFLQF